MEIERMIAATQIVFRMCREHPEICPHDYEWSGTNYKATETLKYYTCTICGKQKTEVLPPNKGRVTFMGQSEPAPET